MESRLIIKKMFFGCVSLSGDCLTLEWIGHDLSLFLLLSHTYVLGNLRSELFLVYGCRLFKFLCCVLFFTADIYTFIYLSYF